jgi:citrate lyase subunit beta/citryl-CoA lyase
MPNNKRVVLFVPLLKKVVNSKIYDKLAREVHAVVFDLEDAVPLQKKDEARKIACEVMQKFAPLNSNIFVRVNNNEMLEADLLAIDASVAKGIVLPKIRARADFEKLISLIQNKMKLHNYKM